MAFSIVHLYVNFVDLLALPSLVLGNNEIFIILAIAICAGLE